MSFNHISQEAGGELRSDHSCGVQKLFGFDRQSVDARGNGGLQCRGHGNLSEITSMRICARPTVKDLSFGKIPNDFVDEERISSCAPDDLLGERAQGGIRTHQLRGKRGSLRIIQWSEDKTLNTRQLYQRSTVFRAVGDYGDRWRPGYRGKEIHQHAFADVIDPMDILDDEDGGLTGEPIALNSPAAKGAYGGSPLEP